MDGAVQACSSKMNIKGKWKRLATPRELFYGIRSDGTIITSCVNLHIECRQQISNKQFEQCVQHFNENVTCFREYLTEGKGNEFWVAVQENSSCTVKEISCPKLSGNHEILEDIINSRHSAESVPSFQFYYIYKGKEETTFDCKFTLTYPHLYQLIFSFHTGTLDDYSCASVCNLFLNNLDCVLKNTQMSTYLHLDLYDIGTNLMHDMAVIRSLMLQDPIKLSNILTTGEIFDSDVSNFKFPSTNKAFAHESGGDDELVLCKTSKLLLNQELTEGFLEVCKELNLSTYSVLVSTFNRVLLKFAKEANILETNLRIKVLHNINTKFVYERINKKMLHQVGSHMLPYLHYITIETGDPDELYVEAKDLEEFFVDLVGSPDLYDQEIVRDILISTLSKSYKLGEWNPKYFYSFSNLGCFDGMYVEHSMNSFYTSSYDRWKTVQDAGCMDITFYIFKKQLNFCVDYSTKHVSDEEVTILLDLLQDTIPSPKIY